MIDSNQALSQLHDIVAAPAAQLWPLAPGWYAVVIIGAVGLLITAMALHRFIQRRRIRDAALKALRTPLASPNAVTLVLKQACLGYFPRAEIAQVSGSAWYDFLLAQLPAAAQRTCAEPLQRLATEAFSPHQQQSTAEYQQLARYWLRHALPPRSRRHD